MLKLPTNIKIGWLKEKPLVAKPDMLFGKRGKNGLVLFKDQKPGDVTLEKAAAWIDEKAKEDVEVYFSFDGDTPTGEPKVDRLTHFIVEPFTPHDQSEEYYISATCVGDEDVLYMSAEGGMEVEEGWDEKVTEVAFPITAKEDEIAEKIKANIPADVKEEDKENFAKFAIGFFRAYRELNFAYLEIKKRESGRWLPVVVLQLYMPTLLLTLQVSKILQTMVSTLVVQLQVRQNSTLRLF